MQRRRFYCGLILFFLAFLLSSTVLVRADVIEQLLVVVDGEPYTLTDFKSYAKAQMGREFPAGDLNQLGKEDQEVIEQFITDKMLASEVKQAGIKVGDEDIENYITQIKDKNQINEPQLREALTAQGISWEKYPRRSGPRSKRATSIRTSGNGSTSPPKTSTVITI